MGLYFKIYGRYSSEEEIMLNLFQNVIEKFKKYFGFEATSKYSLWYEYLDEKQLLEMDEFKIKIFLNRIKTNREKERISIRKIPHYTISSEGYIKLKNPNGTLDNMVIDITGTCTELKENYGNVWINFYDTSIKWQDYFIDNNPRNQIINGNRKKIRFLIDDLKLPKFNLHSIYFAESNIVFDVLNKAYLLYFKEYLYFIEEIIDIIKERINIRDLEYEDLLISDLKRPILSKTQIDLKLFDINELVSIMDQSSPELSYNIELLVKQYPSVIYSPKGSVEISDYLFNPKTVRNIITDIIGNFISILWESLPRYEDMEEKIQTTIRSHKFTREIKKKWSKIDKFT